MQSIGLIGPSRREVVVVVVVIVVVAATANAIFCL
jgi:hypothetical protein